MTSHLRAWHGVSPGEAGQLMVLLLLLVKEVRILLLKLLESHHVLLRLLGLGHGHRKVVEARHGEAGAREAGGRVSGLHTRLSLQIVAQETKLTVHTGEHVGYGASLESLQPPPAHHWVDVTDGLKVLTWHNPVVKQVVSVVNIDNGRRGRGCRSLKAGSGVGGDDSVPQLSGLLLLVLGQVEELS